MSARRRPAPGQALRRLVIGSRPPSPRRTPSGSGRSEVISTREPRRTSLRPPRATRRVAIRTRISGQSRQVLGAKTATSSRPSVGDAVRQHGQPGLKLSDVADKYSHRAIPDGSRPVHADHHVGARAAAQCSSDTSDIRHPAQPKFRLLIRLLDHRGVEPHAGHHDEMPAGTPRRTSMRRRASPNATSTAAESAKGTFRLRASRLPVPDGTRANATPVPARTDAQAATVPSPPHAMTRSAPRAKAVLVWPLPGSSFVVAYHVGFDKSLSAARRLDRLAQCGLVRDARSD